MLQNYQILVPFQIILTYIYEILRLSMSSYSKLDWKCKYWKSSWCGKSGQAISRQRISSNFKQPQNVITNPHLVSNYPLLVPGYVLERSWWWKRWRRALQGRGGGSGGRLWFPIIYKISERVWIIWKSTAGSCLAWFCKKGNYCTFLSLSIN